MQYFCRLSLPVFYYLRTDLNEPVFPLWWSFQGHHSQQQAPIIDPCPWPEVEVFLKYSRNWHKSPVCVLSHFSCVWLCVTVAHKVPLSMGFSRQEYWSGLPFPSPGDLPNPGIEPRPPAWEADSLVSEPPRKLYLSKVSGESINPFTLYFPLV